MKKNLKISLLLIFGFLLSAESFSQTSYEYKTSPTGLRYKVFKNSTNDAKPVAGDWVSVDMRYTTKVKQKDSVLFDTKIQLKGTPARFQLTASEFKGDLYEGIMMLSPGDSGVFLVSADSLFMKTFRMAKRPDGIDSNSTVSFYVHLLTADSPVKMQKDEEISLQKYLKDNNVTVSPTASGVYLIESQKGEGIKIDTGCQVKFQFKVALIDGKQLFSSYERPEPIKFRFGKKVDTRGMEEAIGLLKKGSKAKIIVPSKMAFGETGRGSIVPPYSTLVYEVEILDVQSKAECDKEQAEALEKEQNAPKPAGQPKDDKFLNNQKEEPMLIEKYLADNKITVKPTASGLYYVEKVPGTGKQAVAGKNVKVHYTGTLLNGKKFDSSRDRNEPIAFPLGQGRVIKGWDEGIAMMKEGGRAILIIPSAIGYGPSDMGVIPPYSTLVFDVELVEVN